MTNGLPQILDRVTPLYFTLGLSLLSAVTITVCTVSAYSVDAPLPAPGPPPAQAEKASLRNARYMPTFYRSLVEDDCKKLGLRPVTPESLTLPNAFRKEFTGRQQLGAKRGESSLQTGSLQLKLESRKIWVGSEGGSVRAKHLVLKITNHSTNHLAYRVVTEITDRRRPLGNPNPCDQKSAIAHNGMALKPGETVERTECLVLRRGRFYVRAVEVLDLKPLGYQYASRIEPRALQFSARTSEGHQPAKLPLCRRLPWQLIKAGIDNGHFRWYDVVDFYSRHNCDEYTFFASYRWSPRGSSPLPLKPPAD